MASFSKHSTPSFRTLLSAICARCRPALQRAADATDADRYVKRYRSVDFALALIVHFLKGLSSLRALQVTLDCSGRLTRQVKLGGISLAQLAQLTHRRPAEMWQPLIAELLAQVGGQLPPSLLRVVDSTFFALAVDLMSRCWQRQFAPEAAGVKLTVIFDPDQYAPVACRISIGGGSDAGEGPAVLPEGDISGHIYLADRGFRNYGWLGQLIERGADFVTLAAANTHYQVLEELALDPTQPQIERDQMVRLGSHNAHNRMKSPVRRIVLFDGKRRLIFLSSIFDLAAVQVCDLYRRRWEIEVFFRWLKRQIGCLRPLGYSAQAAEHTIFAALVAYLLVLLMALHTRRYPDDPPAMAQTLYRMQADLHDRPTTTYLQVLRL